MSESPGQEAPSSKPKAKLHQDTYCFVICVVVVIVVVLLFYPYLREAQEYAVTDRTASCKDPSVKNMTSLYSNATPPPIPLPFSSVLGPYRILSLPSEQVILRAVYYDPRQRDGFKDVSVFLVEIEKNLLERKKDGIVACGINGDTNGGATKSLNVRIITNLDWVHHNFPELSHDMAMIDCYGLPKSESGAQAYLWYRVTDGGDLYRVESEQPYHVPTAQSIADKIVSTSNTPRKTVTKSSTTSEIVTRGKVVVCMAVLTGTPPYLREFIRYYKYLGADHIYMVADESIVQTGALESDEFIQKELSEGFISFSFWHKWLTNKEVFYYSQMLAYQNCIYRFQGAYEYAFLVDSDDHFIPLVPQKKKLDYYIETYCNVGACTFKWREYFPDCGQDWSRLGPHGNITNTLLSNRSIEFEYYTGKTIYRLSGALDAGIHSPKRLRKGYKCRDVPPNVAYMAHVRKHRSPPGGRKSC